MVNNKVGESIEMELVVVPVSDVDRAKAMRKAIAKMTSGTGTLRISMRVEAAVARKEAATIAGRYVEQLKGSSR